jgi:hypothetical protein
MLPLYLVIGAIAGLIVSSWQGFKDPPWEGFFLRKFVRSIGVGAGVGGVLLFAASRGFLRIDNLGVLAFAVVAIERVIGETYKGFLRRGAHPEYHKLLARLRIPAHRYAVKLVLGLAFVFGAFELVRGIAAVFDLLVATSGLTMAGVAIGAIAGVIVAIGGALKDSQFEGFLPRKFVRSPIVAAIAGFLFVHFSSDGFLTVLACIGGERVGVELYKTFLRRQVRGIFAGQPPRFPVWLERRYLFGLSYGMAVSVCVALLFARA